MSAEAQTGEIPTGKNPVPPGKNPVPDGKSPEPVADNPVPATDSLVAALTCFNRRDKTLAALQALAVAARQADVPLRAVLLDDGSSDGTAEAARQVQPWVQVLTGPGQQYWSRGMHQALAVAQALPTGEQLPASHVLWLNDDTVLQPDALARLLAQARALRQREGRDCIVVGSTADAQGQISYGGASAPSRWRRFSYRRVYSATEPLRCEVMNGNCVLVPMAVARQLGNIDAYFEHAMGDTDYALRAGRAGHPLYVAAGIVAQCESNPVAGSFNDRSLPLGARWRAILQRKGLPWRSWWHFTRRHGGLLWPVYFAWPYARLVGSALWRGLSATTASPAGR